MSTRSVTLCPRRGWEAFGKGADLEELVWEALATWHYMNPTAKTSVWESPTGATFYLAFGDDGSLVEAVAGFAGDDNEELTALLEQLAADYGVRAAG